MFVNNVVNVIFVILAADANAAEKYILVKALQAHV
jgi:hypothetical protein